ncbi:Potassium transporter 19 [Orchesella cincta]|uniref:Potassium transporter 19 n=1 Tax=Orchesella cincta TaxID=48709 RepID=A0A1D2MZR5_ORCCI|nr:Potassium transporter 19 [Orchesella cincta]
MIATHWELHVLKNNTDQSLSLPLPSLPSTHKLFEAVRFGFKIFKMNPCCCISLQRGTTIFAWIDAVLSSLLLVLFTLGLIGGILYDPSLDTDSPDDVGLSSSQRIQLLITCVLYIAACICQILLALYLRRAAKNNNYRALLRWIIISTIVLLMGAITSGLHLRTALSLGTFLSATAGIAYKTYEIIVVSAFRHELTTSNNLNRDDDSEDCNLQTKEDKAGHVNSTSIDSNVDCV